jgi:hypothetical protein
VRELNSVIDRKSNVIQLDLVEAERFGISRDGDDLIVIAAVPRVQPRAAGAPAGPHAGSPARMRAVVQDRAIGMRVSEHAIVEAGDARDGADTFGLEASKELACVPQEARALRDELLDLRVVVHATGRVLQVQDRAVHPRRLHDADDRVDALRAHEGRGDVEARRPLCPFVHDVGARRTRAARGFGRLMVAMVQRARARRLAFAALSASRHQREREGGENDRNDRDEAPHD